MKKTIYGIIKMVIKMNQETFILETEEGSVECEVLYKLYSKEYQKHYIIYTDHTIDEEGDINIFISSYNPESTTYELNDITDKKELNNITKQLEIMWGNENERNE